MTQQHELQLELPISSNVGKLGNSSKAEPGVQYALQLDDQTLPFHLRRSRRSQVAFLVDERGLQVSAPSGMTLPQIEQAIRAGSRTIVSKMAGKTAGAGKLQLPKHWREGVRLPFLGREIVLCLNTASARAELRDNVLHLPLPPEALERQVRDCAQSWLQAEAQRMLGEQLATCAHMLGIAVPPWQLSFASGSWANIEPDGRVRLSWRLIHLTQQEISRVLQRQLAALKQPAATKELWGSDAT